MSAIKKSVSFPEELYNAATQRQHDLNYATFSDYIQALIRADMKQNPIGGELDPSQASELRDQITQLSRTLNKIAGQPGKYPKAKRRHKLGIPPAPKG